MRIQVKVKAKARQPRVEKVAEGRYKVWVKEPPERGQANEAVAGALGEFLGVPRSQIKMVSGQTWSQKVFEIL